MVESRSINLGVSGFIISDNPLALPEIRHATKVGGQFRQPSKMVLHRDVTLAVLFMGHY